MSKNSIPRILGLVLIGTVVLSLSMAARVAMLPPFKRMLMTKRLCLQAMHRLPVASRLPACAAIDPNSVGKFSCGPEYFPESSYCREPGFPRGCRAEYEIVAGNPDGSVECGCMIRCDQMRPPVDAIDPIPRSAVRQPKKKT